MTAREVTQLRRSIGTFEATVSGVGIIVGAGVYALLGTVAGKAGSAIWLSFAISGFMAATIGVCYAELAAMFPRAGADYEYTSQALGRRAGFVIGWLVVIANLVAAATVALGFAGYFRTLVDVPIVPVAVVLLAAATLIGFAGIEKAVWVSIVLTFIEVAGLVAVIGVGLPHIGDVDLAPRSGQTWAIVSGAALVMFAFIGFEQIATLAEETEDAARVIPRAIILAVAITTALYLLVAVAAVSVLGAERLAGTEAPLAEVLTETVGHRAGDALTLVALFSTANTVLLMLVAASRLVYGMASVEALPRFLAWVHPGAHTPVRAILLSLVVSAGFALPGDISLVASATNFAVFVSFGAVCLSLLVLRFRQPEAARPFRVPFSIARIPLVPVLGLALVVFLAAHLEMDALLLGGGLFVSGLVAMEVLSLWRPSTPKA